MKKVLTLLLALTLLFALTVPVLAINQDSETKSGDVTVSTTVGVKYTVTIPASTQSITLNAESTDIGDIILSDAILEPSQSITVTVTGGGLTAGGAGALVHGANSSKTLPFTMKIGGTATNTTSFTENGTKEVLIDIAAAAWAAAAAGTYSAVLTFTVS